MNYIAFFCKIKVYESVNIKAEINTSVKGSLSAKRYIGQMIKNVFCMDIVQVLIKMWNC